MRSGPIAGRLRHAPGSRAEALTVVADLARDGPTRARRSGSEARRPRSRSLTTAALGARDASRIGVVLPGYRWRDAEAAVATVARGPAGALRTACADGLSGRSRRCAGSCRSACATTGRVTSCGPRRVDDHGGRRRDAPTRPDGSSFILLEAIRGRATIEPAGGAAFGQRSRAGMPVRSASGRIRRTTRPDRLGRERTADRPAAGSLTGAGYGELRPGRRADRTGPRRLRHRSLRAPGARSRRATTRTTSFRFNLTRAGGGLNRSGRSGRSAWPPRSRPRGGPRRVSSAAGACDELVHAQLGVCEQLLAVRQEGDATLVERDACARAAGRRPRARRPCAGARPGRRRTSGPRSAGVSVVVVTRLLVVGSADPVGHALEARGDQHTERRRRRSRTRETAATRRSRIVRPITRVVPVVRGRRRARRARPGSRRPVPGAASAGSRTIAAVVARRTIA